jgi:hypothetical protein
VFTPERVVTNSFGVECLKCLLAFFVCMCVCMHAVRAFSEGICALQLAVKQLYQGPVLEGECMGTDYLWG